MNPVLAVALLAAAALLATRLPRLPTRYALPLAFVIAAGAPLVLVGLVLGPGIELIGHALLRSLTPLTALAIGWIGAMLGARCEWRYVRHIPRRAWLLAGASVAGTLLVVALGAWVLARFVPALGAAWAPRVPTALGLGAVAAVSGPSAVALVARAAGVDRRMARAIQRAGLLETVCGAIAMTLPLALERPHLGAGNPALGWLAWVGGAGGCGAIVGFVFIGLARLRSAGDDLGLALLGSMLFGAGLGYATSLSPFVICALATIVIVNAAPRRRHVRVVLTDWEPAISALFLVVVGALLTLPTAWILVAVPLIAAWRAGARWASVRLAGVALKLRDLPPHIGLATLAQGGAALALGVDYSILGGHSTSLGSVGAGGAGAAGGTGGAVLTTIVLGVALAQLAARPLMVLALRPGPAALTPAPARPELTANAAADS